MLPRSARALLRGRAQFRPVCRRAYAAVEQAQSSAGSAEAAAVAPSKQYIQRKYTLVKDKIVVPEGHKRPAPAEGLTIASEPNAGLEAEEKTSVYHLDAVLLRDLCRCETCVNPSSGQRQFAFSEIPSNIKVRSAGMTSNENISITWDNDIPGFDNDHRTEISQTQIASIVQHRIQLRHIGGRSPWYWTPDQMQSRYEAGQNRATYDDFLNDDEAFKRILRELHIYGLAFFDAVPHDEESVVKLVERIGPLKNTFYGRTWDVKDVPKAKNVAYTSGFLGMHMDLLYMKEPPGLQLLHCLESSCEGGRSLFNDAFAAARELYFGHRSLFDALVNYPVSYHYVAKGTNKYYFDTKPTIELDQYRYSNSPPAKIKKSQPFIANVNWSPPFQGHLVMDAGQKDGAKAVHKYLEAAKAFGGLVNDPERQFKLKLEPGQCVIFNNRRVLHGREAFKSGTGIRWLKGAYVDADDFLSAVRIAQVGNWDEVDPVELA